MFTLSRITEDHKYHCVCSGWVLLPNELHGHCLHAEHLGFLTCRLPSSGEHAPENVQTSVLLKHSAGPPHPSCFWGSRVCWATSPQVPATPIQPRSSLRATWEMTSWQDTPEKCPAAAPAYFIPIWSPNGCQPSSFLLTAPVSWLQRPPRGSIFS